MFALAKVAGFGFDTEIIYLANKFGYQALEVGVVCRHTNESRVNPLLSPLAMTRELFEIRLNDLRGTYNEHAKARTVEV